MIGGLLALWVALSLLCCGPRHTEVTAARRVDVEIRIAPTPDQLPFNPRSSRLLAANRQLTALLGHGLLLDIDAAVAAEWQRDFEHQLIGAVEGLLQLLTVIKAQDPVEFVRTAQGLARVECRYSVLVDQPRAKFEGDTLLIEHPAHPETLIPAYAVRRALNERNTESLDAHFGRAEPESVPVSELAAYFEYLANWARRHRAPGARNARERIANDPTADVIARVARLYSRVDPKDAALRRRVRHWMLARVTWLIQLYRVHGDDLPPTDSNTSMRRGERALCDWLARELPQASAEERLGLTGGLFPGNDPIVCPNIDRFAFGLREVDAWLKAGRPVEGAQSADAQLMDRIVCPSLRDDAKKPVRRHGCHPSWLLYVLADAPQRARLASALDAREPELAEQLLASLHYSRSENVVALIRLLDVRKTALIGALRALADVFGREPPSGTETLLADYWRDQPQLHGALLYVFARSRSAHFWAKFATEYDPIQRPELEAFLDHGALAFESLPVMWQALGTGYSRVQPMVRRLGLIVPDASQPAASPSLRALSAIVTYLCDAGMGTELTALHSALAARAKADPAQQTPLSVLLRDTGPNGCATRGKASFINER